MLGPTEMNNIFQKAIKEAEPHDTIIFNEAEGTIKNVSQNITYVELGKKNDQM